MGCRTARIRQDLAGFELPRELRSAPVLWYQVDERDEDIATLFHYLTLATAQLDSSEAADLPRYSPEYACGLTAFARSFFSGLFVAVPERAVLVFDNC